MKSHQNKNIRQNLVLQVLVFPHLLVYFLFVFFLYFQSISILVVLIFVWQINANFKRFQDLGDVYYGKNENLMRQQKWWLHFFDISFHIIASHSDYYQWFILSNNFRFGWWLIMRSNSSNCYHCDTILDGYSESGVNRQYSYSRFFCKCFMVLSVSFSLFVCLTD